MARRGDDGEHGYDGGAATVASAMAGACEGEELERRGGVWGVLGREGGRFTALAGRGRRRGGEQLRGELRCRRRAPWLPAWQAKQLAGAVAGLGRPGGLAGGPAVAPGKFSPFFCFLIYLIYICNFVELNKIPRQLQKSPNYSWPIVGLFPT